MPHVESWPIKALGWEDNLNDSTSKSNSSALIPVKIERLHFPIYFTYVDIIRIKSQHSTYETGQALEIASTATTESYQQ